MKIITTYILEAEGEGKTLHNIKTDIYTPSVWLKEGESKDDWEEVDEPTPPEPPTPEDAQEDK